MQNGLNTLFLEPDGPEMTIEEKAEIIEILEFVSDTINLSQWND